jgi:hypothetical protein
LAIDCCQVVQQLNRLVKFEGSPPYALPIVQNVMARAEGAVVEMTLEVITPGKEPWEVGPVGCGEGYNVGKPQNVPGTDQGDAPRNHSRCDCKCCQYVKNVYAAGVSCQRPLAFETTARARLSPQVTAAKSRRLGENNCRAGLNETAAPAFTMQDAKPRGEGSLSENLS